MRYRDMYTGFLTKFWIFTLSDAYDPVFFYLHDDQDLLLEDFVLRTTMDGWIDHPSGARYLSDRDLPQGPPPLADWGSKTKLR